MKMTVSRPSILLLLLWMISVAPTVAAQAITETGLFDGITRQSADYSCGPAALSTLFKGVIEQNDVTEYDVINTRKSKGNTDPVGFSLQDLSEAARSFGYNAEWRKISPTELYKISEPVVLLTGLNSEFPHYVVFKGIKDEDAYMADSMRGNVRMPYDELTAEGINSKYPNWYVMAISYNGRKKLTSPLYLASSKSEADIAHFTIEQSNAVTLISLPKDGQILVEHSIALTRSSLEKQQVTLKSKSITNDIAVRYGVSKQTEVGGKIGVANTGQSVRIGDYVLSDRAITQDIQLFVNHKFSFGATDHGDLGILAGISGSRSIQQNDLGFGVSALGYYQGAFGQVVFGGKLFQQIAGTENQPNRQTASVISAYSRPIGSNNVLTLTGVVDFEKAGGAEFELNKYYSLGVGLATIVSKTIQITPSLTYTFGDNSAFSIGVTATYLGSWH